MKKAFILLFTILAFDLTGYSGGCANGLDRLLENREINFKEDPTIFASSVSSPSNQAKGMYLDGSPPQAGFTLSQQIICVGSCIQFTDISTSQSPIIQWNWTLSGGEAIGELNPEESTQQNPEVCYAESGSFWAILAVTNLDGLVGVDSMLITVDPCIGPIVADFGVSDTVICAGSCVDFQNQSLGFQTNYTWIFGGINQVSGEENPQDICYPEPGVYDVTLIVENGVDLPTQITKPAYITVHPCLFNSENSATHKIEIYPNPAQDFVRIILTQNAKAERMIAFSKEGKEIKNLAVTENQFIMNLNNWPRGVYVLRLFDENGNAVAQTKLLKQ